MVRLTLPHYGEDGHYMKCSEDFGCDGNCGDCPELDQLVERLAAYEDTGLTPKQAADATPVVRCKDCKYWEKGKDYEPYCNNWANMMTDTQAEDFCSYGERRRA